MFGAWSTPSPPRGRSGCRDIGRALVDMITSGEMPEEGDPVPPEKIELIRAWIEAGAPDN